MSPRVPTAGLVLDGRDILRAIGCIAVVDGLRQIQVPNGVEGSRRIGRPWILIYIQAEHRLMMHASEQLLLIDELEMVPQPLIHLFTQSTSTGITIQFIRVYEGTYAQLLFGVVPCVRQEAAEQVGLLALQQRIIADRIVESKLSGYRLEFMDEGSTHSFLFQQRGQSFV